MFSSSSWRSRRWLPKDSLCNFLLYLSTNNLIRRGDIAHLHLLANYRHLDRDAGRLYKVAMIPNSGRIMIPMNTEYVVSLGSSPKLWERFVCMGVVLSCDDKGESPLADAVRSASYDTTCLWDGKSTQFSYCLSLDDLESNKPDVEPALSHFNKFEAFAAAHCLTDRVNDWREVSYLCLVERPDVHPEFKEHADSVFKQAKVIGDKYDPDSLDEVLPENAVMGCGCGGPLTFVKVGEKEPGFSKNKKRSDRNAAGMDDSSSASSTGDGSRYSDEGSNPPDDDDFIDVDIEFNSDDEESEQNNSLSDLDDGSDNEHSDNDDGNESDDDVVFLRDMAAGVNFINNQQPNRRNNMQRRRRVNNQRMNNQRRNNRNGMVDGNFISSDSNSGMS